MKKRLAEANLTVKRKCRANAEHKPRKFTVHCGSKLDNSELGNLVQILVCACSFAQNITYEAMLLDENFCNADDSKLNNWVRKLMNCKRISQSVQAIIEGFLKDFYRRIMTSYNN